METKASVSVLGDGQSDTQKAAKTSSKGRGCLVEARKEDKPDPQNLFSGVREEKEYFLLSWSSLNLGESLVAPGS